MDKEINFTIGCFETNYITPVIKSTAPNIYVTFDTETEGVWKIIFTRATDVNGHPATYRMNLNEFIEWETDVPLCYESQVAFCATESCSSEDGLLTEGNSA